MLQTLVLFAYRRGWGQVVHDSGMIGANQLFLDRVACFAINYVAIDLSIAVDDAFFARKVFVLGVDVEGVRLTFGGTQFPAQIFAIDMQTKLIGVLRIVADAVVDVVVRDAGARSERNLTTEVGEEVETIVMMMFDNGQIAVEHHPVDQVRQLAKPPSYPLRRLTFRDDKPFLVAFLRRSASDEFPDGKGLAGRNEQPVDVLHRQRQVRRLVLLQLHIHVTQPTADERVVAIDDYRQRLLRPLLSEQRLPHHVLHVALQDFLLHRQPIGKGRYFAKQSSFHVLMYIALWRGLRASGGITK